MFAMRLLASICRRVSECWPQKAKNGMSGIHYGRLRLDTAPECAALREFSPITPCATRADLGCITSAERRWNWPTENKLKIVVQCLVDGVVMSDVTRRHGIRPQQAGA